MSFERDLIFDIGLHKGIDSKFYLQKGFRVVGVEAREDLCAVAKATIGDLSEAGRLTIVQRALYHISNKTVSFYVNPDKDEWGSLWRREAEKGVGHAHEISVPTITLYDLVESYGGRIEICPRIEGFSTTDLVKRIQDRRKPGAAA